MNVRESRTPALRRRGSRTGPSTKVDRSHQFAGARLAQVKFLLSAEVSDSRQAA